MQNERMDDEIDLGKMLMVLWDKRLIISFCTAAFLLAGFVFALIQPKIYESSSMLRLIPLADHLALMTSGDVAEGIAARIGDENLKASSVIGMLYPERAKDTSMAKLTVRGRDPELSALVANAWAEVYMEKAVAMIVGETEASQSFLFSELKKAEAEMVAGERRLSELAIKNNIDFKSSELELKKDTLQSIQAAVIGNAKKLKTYQIRHAALKNEIKKHKQYKSQAKAIGDDVLWNKIIEGKDLSAVKGQKIYSEEINPIYRKIESELAEIAVEVEFLTNELSYLKKEKDTLHKDVNGLSAKVSEMKILRDERSRAHNIAKSRYDALFLRITGDLIVSPTKSGDIRHISKAAVPGGPVSPNKKKMAGIAALIGFFGGILAAFAADYIEKQPRSL